MAFSAMTTMPLPIFAILDPVLKLPVVCHAPQFLIDEERRYLLANKLPRSIKVFRCNSGLRSVGNV